MNIEKWKLLKHFNCSERTLKVYLCRFSHIIYNLKTESYCNIKKTDLEELKSLIHTRKRQSDKVYRGKDVDS